MNKSKLIRTIVSTVIGTLILIGGYKGYQYLESLKPEPRKKEVTKRIKSVEVVTVDNASINTTLGVQGRLEAYNKIPLFTEVGGSVLETGKPFKQGTYFKKGETLMRIDDAEARLSLQAQKASLLNAMATIMPDLKIDYPESFPAWEAYLSAFDVDSPIAALPEPVNQREKLFIAGRNLYGQYYTIKSGEERLGKYTLRAPFSGVLTTTTVDRGAVVRPGQQLGEIMATGFYEMAATVSLSDLGFLKTGGTVELYSEDINGKWTGKIRRVSDQIDPATQTVKVFIGVSGKDLREGMYLRGDADARTLDNVVEIDRDLLIDEGSVYVVVNDTLLSLLPVDVRKFNRETVIVSGLPQGAKLLTSDVAGAYDGMRVKLRQVTEGTETASGQPVSQTEVPVSR